MSTPQRPATRLQLHTLEDRAVPATAVLSGTTLTIDGTSGNDTITVRQTATQLTVDGETIRDGSKYVSSIVPSRVTRIVVRGAAGNDTISLNGVTIPAQLFGGPGNDRIISGNAATTVYGDQGNDTIFGGSGNDWLVGGDGNDLIYGSGGNDWISGDNGDDKLYGEAGNDTINGGDGRDFLSGGVGNDVLDGHGFGYSRGDLERNFDTYQDDFNFGQPFGATRGGWAKGQLDDSGYLAALRAVAVQLPTTAIKYVGSNLYDVYLAGDKKAVRVRFDGTWNDNDPRPAGVSAPDFSLLLLNRARMQTFGIDLNKYYSDADWIALNKKTNNKLFDPGSIMTQFTGRTSYSSTAAAQDWTALKAKLDRGQSAVATSYRIAVSTTSYAIPTPNRAGILGSTTYTITRLFTDSTGKQWVELYNPWGTDTGSGKLLDNAPTAKKADDGIITLLWSDFRSSANFATVVVS
jgi:Ca2+-binding RTX toxin-like protein